MTKLCKISLLLLMFGLHAALFADNGAQPKRLNRLLDKLSDQLKQKVMGPENAFATNTSPATETKEPEIAILQANLARTGVYEETGPEQLNELVWKFKTEKGFSTPIVYDDTIYVGNGDHHLYAIDYKTGREKWKFKVGDRVFNPTVFDGVIYFSCFDHYLYAVDIKTKKEKWKFKANHMLYTSPLIYEGLIYFGGHDQYFYAVDIKTGREKWKFKSDGSYSIYPAMYNGIIYVGSGNYLYAINSKTGREKWSFYTENTKVGSPAIANETIYFGGNNSILYAINLRTTQQKWKTKLFGDLSAPPAVFNNTIFIGGLYLYAIDEQTGKEKWSKEPEEIIHGSKNGAVITGNTVYFSSTKEPYIYALDINTGKENWKFKTGVNGATNPPIFSKGMAFFSSNDGSIHAVK